MTDKEKPAVPLPIRDDHDPIALKKIFNPGIRENHIIYPTPKYVQDGAMEVSMLNGALPLFALDKKNKTKMEKEYLASGYKTIYAFIKNKIEEKKDRNFYELMLDHVPCDLYVDLDVSLERNPDYDIRPIQKDFISYVKQQMIEYGYCKLESEVETLILDSTDQTKISRHYIFRLTNGKMFRDVMQCGAFMRNLRNRIQESESVDPNKNRFFAWTKRKNEEERNNPLKSLCFIVDMGIYTKHRVFRLCGSTKKGKESYFRPMDENGTITGDFDTMDYDQFAKYFVQRNARYIGNHAKHIVCQEPDGSDAKYTSNLLSYRPDLYPITCKRKWKNHYDNNYPFAKIWKWFGHKNREFCFEYPNEGGVGTGTKWQRPVFFSDETAFRKYVIGKLPVGIHIGPIYETNAKSEVKSKELMFDIDLDSYVDSNQNSIRGCCGKEKKCCSICWELALVAKVILEDVLKKTMGFKKVKFFESGGKGMHCWVMDEEPKTLTKEGRMAILKFLESIKNNPKSLPMVSIVKKFKKQYLLNVLKSLGIEESDKKDKSALLVHIWPRIDSGPTTQPTHAIKSPFALHTSTLNIAKKLK